MADAGNTGVFTPDAGALKAAEASLKSMQSTGARTTAEMKSLQAAMSLFAKTSKEMSKAALVDPRAADRVNKLREGLEKAKVTQEVINKLSEHEVATYEKLSVLDKLRVRYSTMHQENQKRMVMYGNHMVELEAKKNHFLSAGKEVLQRTAGAVSSNVRGVTSMVTSAAGLEFSLMGILMLFMKMRDQQQRIGAMSMQSAAQWQGSSTAIGTASKAMGQLRGEFGKSVDEAGEIIVSMARVGVEEKGISNVARELVAIQELHGISVQESLGFMGQLVKSYDSTSEEASQFLRIARETTKTMPYMSMSEVSNDMMELTKLTRSYNTDLLDTLSLYNTLMKKDVAKHLGLGDAPESVRKDIVKVVAGFNTELGDGWKASLGAGATAAAKILNFEKMKPAEQLQKMAEFITEKTSQYTGAEQEFAVRQLLKQFNFTSAEMQKALGEAFTSGGFSADGLKGVVSAVSGQRDTILKQQAEDKQARKKLMADASSVAKGLMGFEKKLARAIEDAILGSDNGKKIMAWVGNMEAWILKMAPQMIEKMMEGIATIGDLLEVAFGDKEKKRKTARSSNETLQAMDEYFGTESRGTETRLAGVAASSYEEKLDPKLLASMLQEASNAFPVDELNEMVRTLSEFMPEISSSSATPGEQGRIVRSVALQGISAGDKYGTTNELVALINAVSSHNVPALIKLLREQIKDRALIEKQAKKFKGNYRSKTLTAHDQPTTDIGAF